MNFNMRKIMTLVLASIFFISCEKTDEVLNNSQPPANYLLKELLGEDSYSEFDSSIDFISNVTLSPYEPEIHDGYLDILGSFSDEDQVGGILINDRILLSKSDDYYKTYNSEQTEQLAIDKSELFGNNVRLKAIDTNEDSPYYNLDVEAELTSRINHFEVEGLEVSASNADIVGAPRTVIRSYSDLTLSWSATGNPNEDMILVIYETKDVGNGNRPKQLLKRFKNKDKQITVTASELNRTFVDDSDLTFMLVKERQVVRTMSQSGKILSVNSMEFINYSGVKFIK